MHHYPVAIKQDLLAKYRLITFFSAKFFINSIDDIITNHLLFPLHEQV
jgi:hypothetical protein